MCSIGSGCAYWLRYIEVSLVTRWSCKPCMLIMSILHPRPCYHLHINIVCNLEGTFSRMRGELGCRRSGLGSHWSWDRCRRGPLTANLANMFGYTRCLLQLYMSACISMPWIKHVSLTCVVRLTLLLISACIYCNTQLHPLELCLTYCTYPVLQRHEMDTSRRKFHLWAKQRLVIALHQCSMYLLHT